jgi:uncharacterized protein
MTGFRPIPYASLYAATKAFTISFSMALAEEVRQYGVVVVTLCPGGTPTNLVVLWGARIGGEDLRDAHRLLTR